MGNQEKETHFGFQSVSWDEKEKKVEAVFHSVARHYDIMNNIMSMGQHHLWKRFATAASRVRKGDSILDLAGGTGDLTRLFSKKVGMNGKVILADINTSMLNIGRDHLLNEGIYSNVDFIQADAQALPFPENSFHCIIMGFGLRNVTDKVMALREIQRVCKPGGKVLILEFSTPSFPGLKPIYDWYSFNILPKLGQLFAHDAESYQYLVESIRVHPDQKQLKTMIEEAGFEDCHYSNLSGGIVALHTAYKY